VFDDPSVLTSYRSETEHLHAERLPLAVALFLALVGVSGTIQRFCCSGDVALFLLPAVYLCVAAATAGAIALFGAYHLDLHRLAVFCEATRREEAAAISHTLVAIATEINAALDANDVLDRIAGVTRTALRTSWSAIMLRDPRRDCFAIVGSAGRLPDDVARLRGIEFGAGAFPLAERILSEREIVLTDTEVDPALSELMHRWETQSVLGAALLRRQEAVGILITGAQGRTTHFAEHRHELFHGIAQHVAIALSNVRLLADLRRANELKTEFLSTMSHELRTPLNVIIGYTDLLRDEAFGPLAGDQQNVLDRMVLNAHSLLELINSTLEVNRLEAGRSGLNLREIDLRQLLTELQLESEQLPRQPGVTLHWELPHTSESVRTDSVKLKIVVRNLVGNALKFTKRGRVVVKVGFDPRGRMLDVAVRDTGPGIDAAQMPDIFDMFHQGPGAAQRGGVGLGLYIVKRFVDLLGGKVTASSRVGEGSIFHVTVPTGAAAQPASLEEHRRRRSA
jgi:signal transduction histidine kinase